MIDDISTIAKLYGMSDVMRAVQHHIRGDLLDFGSGKGKMKSLCMGHCRSYTAFDLAPHHSVDIVGDVLNPPIADASYDTIISNQVLEHVKKPWIMVEQIARILRPGGVCILTAPFLVPYHAHPDDYFRFTEQGMRFLFEDAGLRVNICTKFGGFWAIMGELIKQKFYSPYQKHSRWKRLIGRLTEKTCRMLSNTTPPGISYCNVLCIAEKPVL